MAPKLIQKSVALLKRILEGANPSGATMKTLVMILLVTLMWTPFALVNLHIYEQRKVEPVKTVPSGIATIEMLAITEDGTKIYRVDHKRSIFPLIIAETRSGYITVR